MSLFIEKQTRLRLVLTNTGKLRLRYIACCRTSFYNTVAVMSRHRQVHLSPVVHDGLENWLAEYQQQAVRHILRRSGIDI